MSTPALVPPQAGTCECGAHVPNRDRPCPSCMAKAKQEGERRLAFLIHDPSFRAKFGHPTPSPAAVEAAVRRAWTRLLPKEWSNP